MKHHVSDGPLGGDRDLLNRTKLLPHHRLRFISVQDVTEDSKTVGDPSQSEDGEDESTSLSDPSDEQSMGKVETVEGKPEVTAAQPRRASTSPPPKPVKLLTRMGSLDCEFPRRTLT